MMCRSINYFSEHDESIFIYYTIYKLAPIPVSGDLKIGLLKSAIRKAGLDDDCVLEALKG